MTTRDKVDEREIHDEAERDEYVERVPVLTDPAWERSFADRVEVFHDESLTFVEALDWMMRITEARATRDTGGLG